MATNLSVRFIGPQTFRRMPITLLGSAARSLGAAKKKLHRGPTSRVQKSGFPRRMTRPYAFTSRTGRP
jgi:hypothetical protein